MRFAENKILLNLCIAVILCAAAIYFKQCHNPTLEISSKISNPSQFETSTKNLTINLRQTSPASMSPSEIIPSKNVRPDKPSLLRALESKYKTSLSITKDSKGNPYRLTGEMKWPDEDKDSPEKLARLLGAVAPILGIDRPEQLKHSGSQNGALGEIQNFAQILDGIAVEPGQVRIHLDLSGNPILINSTFQSGVDPGQINSTPSVSAQEAVLAAFNHSRTLDSNPNDPNHRLDQIQEPVLVIYNFTELRRFDIAWKVILTQPWLGPKHAIGRYFVNAHQTNILERREGSIQ